MIEGHRSTWVEGAGAPSRRVVTIGSAPDNDVVLDYPIVSGHHARLVIEHDEARIEDLGSTNGTSVGRPGARIRSFPLTREDAVFFGSLRVPAERLLEGRLALGGDPHGTRLLGTEALLAGRDPAAGLVLDDPAVSWHHAKLERHGAAVRLEDLGSTNGTFVNGRRVSGRVALAVGDLVALGGTTLLLRSLEHLEVRDVRGNLSIEARDVAVDVPGRRLLERVSLTLYPGELVGLMGPSGAGKTTLMLAMNGYMPPAEGQLLYGGQDLYRHYDQFRLHLGYVPQDDIMHGDLTVREALYSSARLRLPADMRGAEIEARLAKVLDQLGLAGTEDVLIGSPTKKGISGGQRKRVNLAMELLTDPSVLFLDEPTSGLSSEDALMVMNVLRELADAGKTILLTIHQPSREVFRQMDNLVLLARDPGSEVPAGLAFYGPAYPDSIHFLSPEEKDRPDPSPDRLLEGLKRRSAPDQIAAYAASSYRHRYVDQRSEGAAVAGVAAGEPPPHRATTGAFLQWRALSMRCLRIKVRDLANSAILLLQAPVIALLIVMVFGADVRAEMVPETWQEGAGATAKTVFLLAIAALWFGCSNAAREIVAEWSVYHRERMINLALPAYVGSKLAILGAICTVQCAALAIIVHRGCGLRTPPGPLLAVLVLASLVGMALGLLLSARSPSSEVAISLVPLVLLPMVILGGILQPPHKMGAVGALSSLMPSRWAFETMLVMESEQRPESPEIRLPGQPVRPGKDVAEPYFPNQHRSAAATPIAVLILMLGVEIAATAGVLKARDVHP